MPPTPDQLQAAIDAFEAQRAVLGDAVVDAGLAAMRAQLAALVAPPPAPADQSLKLVAVLFLDVVGSTALSQILDPEETHVVMDGALERCTEIVHAHQGRVLKYAGDSILAVFGADGAQEDDSERAVLTGLALLAEGKRQGAAVEARYGHAGFDVRVGVHTGGVLLGGGVDADSSIRGMAVNVAARMEQTAPPGALRISHDTYRHVRGVFDVEPQAPIVVKGVDEPVVTYLVERVKPRAFRVATRGIEGVETRMIGRDAEFERLQDAFKRVHRERGLVAVTVVADAGVGKSRLLYEFENWAEARAERFLVFQGRAVPQTQGQPYGLLRDLLARRLEIADTDSVDAAKRKIDDGITPLFDDEAADGMAEAHAHFLGHLIGLDFSDSPHVHGAELDGKQIRNRGFHAAAQMLRRMVARDGIPAIVVLDDLHWSDDGSLDFLDYLMQVDRDVPILVLAVSRPTLFERRRDWPATADAVRIDLLPLDKGFSRLLANELLKKLPDIPAALRELVTGGADGNPFYMEELVKMLVDEGAIRIGDAWSVVPEKLLATRVPQTLTGVLQARLDGLAPTEKLALQQASVIGLVFWDQALRAVDAAAIDGLSSLVQRELIVPRVETSLAGVGEYAFRHQILHLVTYDTLLKRARREAHAKAASWLAGLTGARANDFLGMTAEHYEKAGDDANAREFFTRAAEHAAERHAHQAALEYVSRALALAAPDDHASRWRLVDVRERMLDLQGQRQKQRADIDELQRIADASDDDGRRGEVAWRRSDLALHVADYRACVDAARYAIAVATRIGDDVLRLRALHRLAGALCMMGETAEARALAEEGLEVARAGGLRALEGRFYNTLTVVAAAADDMMMALDTNGRQLEITRELGDRRSEARTLINLGIAWLTIGIRDEARRHLEDGLRLTRAVGDRALEPYALFGLSVLALRRGDDAQALAYAETALKIAVDVHDPHTEAISLRQVGHSELALGRHANAAAAFERAHAVASAIDHVQRYDAAAGRALVALARGDVGTALSHLDEVLAHLADGRSLDGTDNPLLIRLACYEVLARADDPRAAESLTTAYDELQARAATVADLALRRSFLTDVPEHRRIVAAWTAHRAAATHPG